MHRRSEDIVWLDNICRLLRVFQGIVNDQPSLLSPRTRIALQLSFDLLNRQRGRHIALAMSFLFVFKDSFLYSIAKHESVYSVN